MPEPRRTGWATPPNNLEYFLTALFDSMKRRGRKRPGFFDAVFLVTRQNRSWKYQPVPPIQGLRPNIGGAGQRALASSGGGGFPDLDADEVADGG